MIQKVQKLYHHKLIRELWTLLISIYLKQIKRKFYFLNKTLKKSTKNVKVLTYVFYLMLLFLWINGLFRPKNKLKKFAKELRMINKELLLDILVLYIEILTKNIIAQKF